MTLNVRRAINRHTGVTVQVQTQSAGHWNEDNDWVEGGLSDAIPMLAVVKPIGQLDHEGIYGDKLDVRDEGERQSEHIGFWTQAKLGMRSIVYHEGRRYKIVRIGNYNPYGYYVSIGRWGGDE